MNDQVDLYLGGDLGLWVLDQVTPYSVGHVCTCDPHLAAAATQRGLRVHVSDKPSVIFRPARAGLSVHYPRILPSEHIRAYARLYNLHPGYLPWGRGYYPVFWALWEQTPAGATLHEITPELDKGPIVAQLEVKYSTDDTGGSLLERVRAAEKTIFTEHWERIVEDPEGIASYEQVGPGTYHAKREFIRIQTSTDWQAMSGSELMRLLQCLTCPGWPGLLIKLGEQTYDLHLEAYST